MDSYMKLDWSRQHRRSEQRLLEYFAIDFSRYEEDIFNLHINEIDPVHQLGDTFQEDLPPLEYPVDPRSGTEVRQLEIDTSRKLRLYDQFPSGSLLSRAEHQHCLGVLNRLNMRLGFESAEEKEALERYNGLMEKVGKERKLFESFVKNYFNSTLFSRKSSIDAELDELVVAFWMGKVGKLLQGISNGRYQLMTAVMWLPYKENETNVRFEPVSDEVLEQGIVRKISTEQMFHCSTLKRSKRLMDKYFEEQHLAVVVDDSAQVGEILREDEEVRFVVNSGTLSYLLNYGLNRHERWMVPFRIETIGNRNVIFIDKKLQPTSLLTHERNVKAHKYMVRSFMSAIKRETSHGTEKHTEEGKKDNPKEMEFKVVEFDEYLRRFEKSQPPPKYQQDSRLQMWKLQTGEEQYRFLVRSRMDCYESLRKVKFYINISVKLEYQAEFGAEQMTEGELIHEWARQYLRPNSKTLRLRINAATHVLLSHHYLELKDIEEELKRSYDIDPKNLITNLWQTLKLILNFPPGEYLMQHDAKNAEAAMILTNDIKMASSCTVDLKELYKTVEYERCAVEQYAWIPIDKNVITQLHREHILLPCTFPHWVNKKHIVSREKFKPKPKATPPQPVKKKKSKGNKARRKQRLQEQKQKLQLQTAHVNEVQKSLNQYAPYSGPSKSDQATTSSGNQTTKKDAKNSPFGFAKGGETFDYQSYVMQANARHDDQ